MSSVCFIYSDHAGESHSYILRCKDPGLALRDHGVDVRFVFYQDWISQTFYAMDSINRSSTIILQRNLFGPSLDAVVELKAKGKKVILDLDDHYFEMPPSCAAYPFWHKGLVSSGGKLVKVGYDPLADLFVGTDLVDLITTPSRYLSSWWQYQTRTPVLFLPNYLDTATYLDHRIIPHDPDHQVIGWGGGNTHLDSFTNSNILPAIEKICKENEKIQFLVVGGDKPIPLNIRPSQLHYIPHVSYPEWPGLISMFDVFVIPLSGSSYDKSRSWLKVLEAQLVGVPWVASDQEPYHEFSTGDSFHLTPNTSEDWESKILFALSNYPSKSDKLEREQKSAEDFDISKNISEWENII